ncbi:MAG: transglycosylase SLT domain-containing protein [Kiritimatiellae bacterium]|nr:transglycosylase SLT domain-containing protein [Kiritimatiellia bacterium]
MYKNTYMLVLITAVIFFAGVPQAFPQNTYPHARNLLNQLVAQKWGEARVVSPSPTVFVQYESDLGERWIVDFESGDVTLECLWPAETNLNDPSVGSCMACAVSNLFLSVPLLPEEMLLKQQQAGLIHAQAARSQPEEYIVRKGDTLSRISLLMQVPMESIMEANALPDPNKIRIGQRLLIPVSPPHMHKHGGEHQRADESMLRDQLIDPETGEVINFDNVSDYSQRAIKNYGVQGELINGGDGLPRGLSRVKLTLAEQHLQIRARRYYPMVLENAKRFGHDPALIMAIIHTESAFNPMAASGADAYGLMQLVPSAGGREAYRWLHSKDIEPSPAYLLRPRENLELGTAYIKILQDRIFGDVINSQSRLYCAVAAYNGGAGNVGRAFTGIKSVQNSVNRINSRSSAQVLSTLRNKAPYQETRDYMEKVFQRVALYRTAQWQIAQ